jgi:hypothetical protein
VPFVEHFLEKVDINNKKIIIRNVEGLIWWKLIFLHYSLTFLISF